MADNETWQVKKQEVDATFQKEVSCLKNMFTWTDHKNKVIYYISGKISL